MIFSSSRKLLSAMQDTIPQYKKTSLAVKIQKVHVSYHDLKDVDLSLRSNDSIYFLKTSSHRDMSINFFVPIHSMTNACNSRLQQMAHRTTGHGPEFKCNTQSEFTTQIWMYFT